uniref:Uncharacterized protein n=1 Tax=viral metagenome TaxID=1070528 RepID=A0A6M3LEL4_9ZZZZ
MIKISKLAPGMVVFDCHSYKMGNTTLKSYGIWNVRIVEVGADHVIASWNGNPPQKFYQKSFASWYLKKPVLIKYGCCGAYRKATREERAANL